MGIAKDVFSPQTSVCEVSFGGFALGEGKAGLLVGKESENCACGNGVLGTGVGTALYRMQDGDVLPLPGSLPEIDGFFFVYEKGEEGGYTEALGFISTVGSVYIYSAYTSGFVLWHSFGVRMKALAAMDENEEWVTLFIGEAGVFRYAASGPVATAITSASTAACVFKDRVFCAVEPFTVRYGAPLKPTAFGESINDGGRICFPSERGKIVALVPFREKIFVFYEYAIASLEAAGAARDFLFEKLSYHGGRIFGDSVGVCSVGGEKIFFLAEDGLYAFDGSKAESICADLKISPLRGEQVCNHACFEGKYFLRFPDVNGEKRAVVVDAETEKGYYAFAPEGLCSVGGRGFCSSDSRVRTLAFDGDLPKGETYTFSATGQTFGVRGVKTLKTLVFEGEGTFGVCVSNGRKEKTVDLQFEEGVAKAKIGLKGKAFSLKFVLTKGTLLRKMTAEISKLKGLKA